MMWGGGGGLQWLTEHMSQYVYMTFFSSSDIFFMNNEDTLSPGRRQILVKFCV